MDAFEGDLEISWAPPKEDLFGPMTFVGVSSAGAVVGGIELWQNQRDRYWFLELLIRAQAPEYRGLGIDLAQAAMDWVLPFSTGAKYGVRVHAMTREPDAVRFWTRRLGRVPDFDDAFMRSPDYHFPAVGWVILA
jgi:hypothetical protein